jgi:hypothetical protein
MGQQNSKFKFRIPNEKLYKLSYELTVKVNDNQNELKFINLSDALKDFSPNIDPIIQYFYHKLKQSGYVLKPLNIEFVYMSINEIINKINLKGFPVVNNSSINDIKLIKKCYEVSLNTIYYFINNDSILLALIILNEEFLIHVLKINENLQNKVITDVVLIVGYTDKTFFIKNKWSEENQILEIENKYLNNIKEIWNISIKTYNYN